ncbi:hypothetical protein [Edwardsiella piscicida]|uniref:Uncharacterized protein n=1 Tax=Edwardsiella phage GF-2 TaxID=1537091 RepID=A0A077KC59_9CAUD|nr:hypothetical protein [Edwardsiella piscicida]YP_009126674.1 hypothetical protein VC56_gp71 [Edwardsiella phage GF-2]EKS7767181.1 hypothetical protein [Edwardsiella piscicida]ELM3659693.1 hypothetical protein [Edwardsiella piscicida]ELM3659783.1 hypothetical protein [Edwardsiella piscicida]ELM3737105.1 hypothetical protein [Edwardsiella piscicida]UCQ29755.1 hypothetical protein DCF74_09605 [Edwardsiella piscicida]
MNTYRITCTWNAFPFEIELVSKSHLTAHAVFMRFVGISGAIVRDLDIQEVA